MTSPKKEESVQNEQLNHPDLSCSVGRLDWTVEVLKFSTFSFLLWRLLHFASPMSAVNQLGASEKAYRIQISVVHSLGSTLMDDDSVRAGFESSARS